MNNYGDNKRNIFIFLIIISTFSLAIFLPSIKHEFLNWDDGSYVVNNSDIRDLSLKNIKTIFTRDYKSSYVPFVMLSYIIEYKLFGLNSSVYHGTNIFLHLLNSILVFIFIYLLTKNDIISFMVSILFTVHPLHVESVAWISERKDVLYTLFYFFSLNFYLLFLKNNKKTYYVFSILFFLFSLFSKSMAVSLPLVLLLCDYFIKGKIENKDLENKIPFFIITFIFMVITINIQHKEELTSRRFNVSPIERLIAVFFCAGFYIVKMFFPFKLSCLYPYTEILKSIPAELLFFSILVTVSLLILIFFYKGVSRMLFFGGLFYLITILPVLQIIPIKGYTIVADRYTYVPLVGIFFVISGYLLIGFEKIKNRKFRVFMGILISFIVIFFISLSFKRVLIWKDNFTLWSDVINNYPYLAVAYNNMASAYYEKKEYDTAIVYFTKAIELAPGESDYYLNRGFCYFMKKEYIPAIDDFTKTINIQKKNDLEPYLKRGISYYEISQYDRAIEDFTTVLRLSQNSFEAYYYRSLCYRKKNMNFQAEEDILKAKKINPLFFSKVIPYEAEKHYKDGDEYGKKGNYDLAIEKFNKAIEIFPEYYDAYYARAVAYYLKKDYRKAIEDVKKLKNVEYKINPQFLKLLEDAVKK